MDTMSRGLLRISEKNQHNELYQYNTTDDTELILLRKIYT